jgi:hypothetical protein
MASPTESSSSQAPPDNSIVKVVFASLVGTAAEP